MNSVTTAMWVLLSAALHAFWSALIKRQRNVQAATLGMLTVAVTLSVGAGLLRRIWFPSHTALACALAAGLCEAGYFATLWRSLTVGPFGQYYPVSRGGSLLIIWPVSMIWLGENAGGLSLAGGALIILGLFAISWQRGEALRWRANGLGWAIVSAAFIAGYNLLYKEAMAQGSEPATLFATSMSIALILNVAGFANRRGEIFEVLSKSAIPMILAGVLCCVSFWIFLWCLERGGAGAMVSLRNTSVLFAQAFSWWIGERPGPVRIAGAAAIAAGAILLTG